MNNKIITSMNVQDREVRVMRVGNEDYISLTDIARLRNVDIPSSVIKKWMSSFNTVEFLGLWEKLNNGNFNWTEFGLIKNDSPKNSFTLSPSQWCSRVNAIGIITSKGKYSVGVFAHFYKNKLRKEMIYG